MVVTGNEDSAHHVISEIAGGLMDIGHTIPGRAVATNLHAVARALGTTPIGPPPA
ncbi:hypothetical protein GCM10018987_11080 [Streptomyces cremeus]